MFAKLQIELDCENLSYHQSSNLHGVLMKTMDTEYAGVGIKPELGMGSISVRK